MKIGSHGSLAEGARKSKHDGEFVEKFKKAGAQVLGNATEVLFKDHASTQEQKDQAVSDLRDLRSAMMVCIDRVEDGRESNFAEIKKAGNEAYSGRHKARTEKGEEKGITHQYDQESIRVQGEYGKVGRAEYGKMRFFKPEGDDMTGPKNFLGTLHKVVAVATAVAALPPGPIAMSVGTFAKEEASSEMHAQAQASQQSSGGGDVGLGLLGAWGGQSSGSLRATVDANSNYMKVSTDERVIAALDDLSLMMDQATSKPENQVTINGTQVVTTEKHKDRWYWFDSTEKLSTRAETREISTHQYEPDRLWMPASGLAEYQ